jgi:hypothetical protein
MKDFKIIENELEDIFCRINDCRSIDNYDGIRKVRREVLGGVRTIDDINDIVINRLNERLMLGCFK